MTMPLIRCSFFATIMFIAVWNVAVAIRERMAFLSTRKRLAQMLNSFFCSFCFERMGQGVEGKILAGEISCLLTLQKLSSIGGKLGDLSLDVIDLQLFALEAQFSSFLLNLDYITCAIRV